MKKINRVTLRDLIEESSFDTEEALIMLWDEGITWIQEPNDILIGAELRKARKVLLLPDGKKFKTKEYWKITLKLTDEEFNELLNELDIPVRINAKNLPKGSVSKLKKEYKKQHWPKSELAENVSTVEEPLGKKPDYELREIGHRKDIRYIEYEEIKKFHFALVDDFKKQEDPIDPAGIRVEGLLKSAVFRQHTSLAHKLKYPTVEMAAAALVHSLIHNHPFHNGNKRTALVTLLVFLDENGLMIFCDEKELFKFILLVAQHRIGDVQPGDFADKEVSEIAKWVCNNSRIIEKGERVIPFRKLRHILNDYGCVLEQVGPGCNMHLTREITEKGFLKKKKQTLRSNIYYGGDGKDVKKGDISRIRSDLLLNEEHGVDSYAFYNKAKATVDDFIVNYRKTLKRLAGM